MTVESGTPRVDALDEVVGVLRDWQLHAISLQLHPGDVGWFWRAGADATAAALRTWRRRGQLVVVGLLDGPDLIRLAIAPDALRDEELARQLVADLGEPERGVLGAGVAFVEAPTGALVTELLRRHGWHVDAAWTPLRRDLADPVPPPDLRIEMVGPDHLANRIAVHCAAFDVATFTDDAWRTMAAGVAYADARCLVGYDDRGHAVAAATVWSAGAGRPGLLEPLGVHPDHRGHGHGIAISVAAAAALRELGSSSADVCTPSSNIAAVATYRAAGFDLLPERYDSRRDA